MFQQFNETLDGLCEGGHREVNGEERGWAKKEREDGQKRNEKGEGRVSHDGWGGGGGGGGVKDV